MKISIFFLAPLLLTLLAATSSSADAVNVVRGRPQVKSQTFLSPPIFLRPGDVADKYYYDIPFPRGHLALKSFNGEVVDEHGVPVPLHETYLHHWVVQPYFSSTTNHTSSAAAGGAAPKTIPGRNSGVCNGTLGQYYGLGSETRRTATWVPDPYGIEIGDPAAAPDGYEQRWFLNVHAIDTRAPVADEDKLACTECRCDLYNVSADARGRRLPAGYSGGLRCCYDRTRCALSPSSSAADEVPRKVFLRYTVMWQEWDDAAVVPVKIYIFDVANCKVEYDVEACSAAAGAGEDDDGAAAGNECVHEQVATQVLEKGGEVVFGVAHQHSGGIAAALRGEDGRLLCESAATYGEGEEAGDEAGYIVGMSTCYPKPGEVTVRDGEKLTVVSRYSSRRRHTGVMGLFYILVAEHDDQQRKQMMADAAKAPGLCFSFPVSWCLPSWLSSNM